MSTIEKFSTSKVLRIQVDRNIQHELFNLIQSTVRNRGLAQDELDNIANLPIDKLSVKKIIQLNIDEGNLIKKDGFIIPNKRKGVR